MKSQEREITDGSWIEIFRLLGEQKAKSGVIEKKTVDVSGDFLCFSVFIYEEREHTMLHRFYSNKSLNIFTVMVGGYLKSTEDDIYKDSKS